MARTYKSLVWMGSSRKDLQAMPEDIKDVFGGAILDVQYGDRPVGARPFGEGLPSDIIKLSENHLGNAYRASYTVSFPPAVYVLDVFVKKSRSGIATPRRDRERVLARYMAAARDARRRNRGVREGER